MRLYCILIIMLSFFSIKVMADVPQAWTKAPYAYDAKNVSINKVLKDFSKTFGVSLQVDNLKNAQVNGKLKSDNAKDFLERLALQYHFQWFFYNQTLYISPRQDETSASISVSKDAVTNLKDALTKIGLLDSRFGWGELPDEGVVIVSGPKRYVDFVKALSKRKAHGKKGLTLMVFPLHYASATDRNIKYRDKNIVVPGVASILKKLLDNGASPSVSDVAENSMPSGQNNGSNGVSGAIESYKKMQNSASQGIKSAIRSSSGDSDSSLDDLSDGDNGVVVSADTRSNAIIVYDSPDKRKMYESLIKKLDVPRKVIEINAVILDIDRTKLAQLGINWQAGSNQKGVSFNASGNSPFLPTGSSATVRINNFGHFFSQIRALQNKGEASLIASPSILTVENLPAVIDFNHTNFIRSVGERVANVQSVTVGTSLRVTARSISNDNDSKRINDAVNHLIQLNLNIEDGSIDGSQGPNSDLPNVKSSNIDTQTVMETNRSLVVGGFNVTQNQKSDSKIPLLGDIPGIGGLFHYKDNSYSDRERLFIITPRLVGTEANPLKYVSDKNRDVLEKTLDKEKKRYDGKPADISRTEIESAFEQFSNHYIPKGFSVPVKSEHEDSLSDHCESGQLDIVPGKVEHYENKRYRVLIGLVKNTTSEPQRFDEAYCSRKDTLAVTVMPKAIIQPGQEAEVMMAIRKSTHDQKMRQRLIDGQAVGEDK